MVDLRYSRITRHFILRALLINSDYVIGRDKNLFKNRKCLKNDHEVYGEI